MALYLQPSEENHRERIIISEGMVLGLAEALIILMGIFPSMLLEFQYRQFFWFIRLKRTLVSERACTVRHSGLDPESIFILK